MTNRKSTNSRLELYSETLEQRQLLAGNVTMVINNSGDVILTGDAEDNSIELSVLDFLGEFVGVIQGEDNTTITFNGETGSAHLFELSSLPEGEYPAAGQPAIAGDLRITMKGGDDVVNIVPVQRPVQLVGLSAIGDLRVNMGAGDDIFRYEGGDTSPAAFDNFGFPFPLSGVLGSTTIVGGGGAASDRLYLERFLGFGNIRMTTGTNGGPFDAMRLSDSYAGSDVQMTGGAGTTYAFVVDSGVQGNVSIRTGSGADGLGVGHSFIRGNVQLNAGSSSEQFDDVTVGSSRIRGDVHVTGGGGATEVQFKSTSILESTLIEGDTRVNTGGGNDFVQIWNNELTTFEGSFSVATGSGDDQFYVEGKTLFLDAFSASMGGGDDLIEFRFDPIEDVIDGMLSPATALSSARINGQGGFDILVDPNNAVWARGYQDLSIEEVRI